jgi:endonuclease/exonuclease/phosphatase family metal-dependent hydrolase
MPDVAAEAQTLVADTDVLFAGDFNTSGCDDCSPTLSSDEEITTVVDQFDEPMHPLRLIGASESCSREDGDQSYLLDHFAAADAMQEVPGQAIARVSGICDEINCGRLRNWHEDARKRLSDHCPLTLDLEATDQD